MGVKLRQVEGRGCSRSHCIEKLNLRLSSALIRVHESIGKMCYLSFCLPSLTWRYFLMTRRENSGRPILSHKKFILVRFLAFVKVRIVFPSLFCR